MAVLLFLNFNYFSWLSRESRCGLRTTQTGMKIKVAYERLFLCLKSSPRKALLCINVF